MLPEYYGNCKVIVKSILALSPALWTIDDQCRCEIWIDPYFARKIEEGVVPKWVIDEVLKHEHDEYELTMQMLKKRGKTCDDIKREMEEYMFGIPEAEEAHKILVEKDPQYNKALKWISTHLYNW